MCYMSWIQGMSKRSPSAESLFESNNGIFYVKPQLTFPYNKIINTVFLHPKVAGFVSSYDDSPNFSPTFSPPS